MNQKLLTTRLEVANLRPRPPICVGCPLNPTTEGFDPLRGGAYIPISGPEDAPLAIIGMAGGEEEELKGESFVGPSGRKILRALEWGGEEEGGADSIPQESANRGVPVDPPSPPPLRVRKLNLVQCRTTEIGRQGRIINRDPLAAEIRFCAHRFLWPELAKKAGPRVVMPLGKLAYDWLTMVGPKRKEIGPQEGGSYSLRDEQIRQVPRGPQW